MMVIKLLCIMLLLLYNGIVNCANDEGLTQLITLIRSQNCSSLLLQNQFQFDISAQFPIVNKIFTNQTIYNFMSLYFTKIGNSLELIARFIELNPTENLTNFVKSLTQLDYSIKFVSLCINNQLYHSGYYSKDLMEKLCQRNEQKLIGLGDTSILDVANRNNKLIDNILFESLFCMSNSDNNENREQFFVRLIYNMQVNQKRLKLLFDIDVTYLTLDQCLTKLDHCKSETTKCIYHHFTNNSKFSLGNYYCKCRRGFFIGQKNVPSSGFPGELVESEYQRHDPSDPIKSDYYRLNCQPCQTGCDECNSDSPCRFKHDSMILRGLPLALQSFCVTLCIVVGFGIFQLRRTRVIKTGHWLLLELFLLGAILMFCTIINLYFVPSEITCAIRPLLREIGFVLMYGVLYVKIYRVLCTFQSRKAQRVYVRDQDIFRFLGVLIVICAGHLIAWLATGFDHKLSQHYPTFSHEQSLYSEPSSITIVVCRSKYWDVVSYFYEVFLLALTIYSCKCVKSAPTEYGEVKFITIAVINEFVIGLIFIVIRMSLAETVHPDYIFLINFLHCHATTTISVILLIGPKLWYLYRPPVTSSGGKPRLIPHTDSHIIQTQHKLNGDVDLVEINLADMDPETIRDELKRLYTQLEIYKTRVMRKDNPHITRKRGNRKQRRFSLQHFHKKHHIATNTTTTASVLEDEPSKISEDSGGNSGAEDINLTNINSK